MRDLPLPTFPISGLGAPGVPWRSLHRQPQHDRAPGGDKDRFHVVWARDEKDILEAQRLRQLVFAAEMRAHLTVPVGSPSGHDVDVFDPYCEHLLVRVQGADDELNPVIGTCRVLTPGSARRVGGFCSDTEFDLTRLRPLRAKMVELGRAYVHPSWRSGGVIAALWCALAEFMQRNQFDTVVGCASVGMRDGGHFAASLWHRLRETHLAPIEWRIEPRLPLPVADLRHDLDVDPPALIKAFLRCGAKVLGAPACDPGFNTAGLPMLLRIEDLPARYRLHVLGA